MQKLEEMYLSSHNRLSRWIGLVGKMIIRYEERSSAPDPG